MALLFLPQNRISVRTRQIQLTAAPGGELRLQPPGDAARAPRLYKDAGVSHVSSSVVLNMPFRRGGPAWLGPFARK